MIITILIFVLILGILVFVHELGHFLIAKRMGMAVHEFGFGFPPRLIGWRKKDLKLSKFSFKNWEIIAGPKLKTNLNNENVDNTIYSLNALLFGGFVKIKGEQGDHQKDSNSFASKKPWQRFLTLSAGVGMNFFLGIILLSIGFAIGPPTFINDQTPKKAIIKEIHIQILQVADNSPASEAKIKAGDIIRFVDNAEIVELLQFQDYIKEKLEVPITITYTRGQESNTVTITPKDLNNTGEGLLGVWLAETGLISYPWYLAIWNGIKATFAIIWQIAAALYLIIKNLLTAQSIGSDIAGPIGIAVMTGQVAKLGFIYLLQFTALLSINLAIINILPIPALDGGRILFLIIEKIKGKPINQRIESTIHNIGFLLLIGLIILVTFKDISRFSEAIKGVIGKIF